MKRTTPLGRSAPLERRTRIRPVSDRRRKRDKGYPRARMDVFERGQGQCEHVDQTTGVRCPSPMDDVHHLAGRLGPDPHRLDNLAGLCRWHHEMAHRNPAWARAVGLMRTRLGGDGGAA